MKYVSLDIETTGLDPKLDQVIMVGMIVEDTEKRLPREELPTFACFVRHHRYNGGAYALWMNAWIFEILGKSKMLNKYPIYAHDKWESEALKFLDAHFPNDKVVPAGKNVGSFDLQFFTGELRKKFIHRNIDPGSMFLDWSQKRPQSLDDIKKKLGIEGEVTHDAVDDAWDVIQVLRSTY